MPLIVRFTLEEVGYFGGKRFLAILEESKRLPVRRQLVVRANSRTEAYTEAPNFFASFIGVLISKTQSVIGSIESVGSHRFPIGRLIWLAAVRGNERHSWCSQGAQLPVAHSVARSLSPHSARQGLMNGLETVASEARDTMACSGSDVFFQ